MLGRDRSTAPSGSASPPAVQAYVAARTEGDAADQRARRASPPPSASARSSARRSRRSSSSRRSACPAPLDRLRGDRRCSCSPWSCCACPTTRRRSAARGPIVAYPVDRRRAAPSRRREERERRPRLRWRDPRVLPWHMIGIVGGHGHAALLGVIGFLVIDRLSLPLDQAQQWIAIVLMAGAAATPARAMVADPAARPRRRAQLVVWGSLLAAGGSALTGLAEGIYGHHPRLRAGLARLRPVPARLHQRRLARGRARRAECGGRAGHLGERRRLRRRAGARRRRSTARAGRCPSSRPPR